MSATHTDHDIRRNLTFDLIENARQQPDAPALLTSTDEISYAKLDQLVWQSAKYLHEQGVRSGDIIALTFAEDLNLALTMLGLIRLGATVYSVPRSSTPFQQEEMLRRVTVKLLGTDQPQRFPGNRVPVVSLTVKLLEQRLASGEHADPDILEHRPDAPWLLSIGSGTTGNPKLIPVSHQQGRTRIAILQPWAPVRSQDRCIDLSNLDFATAKSRFCRALSVGASFFLLDRQSLDPITLCEKHRLTAMTATTFHAEQMLSRLPVDTENALSSLRSFMLASSTVSDALRARVRRHLCPHLFLNYGTNETWTVSLAMPPEVYDIPGTVGKVLPDVTLEIVDDQDRAVPVGTVGHIRIKSPAMIDGYLDDPEANAECFINGWFYPGDLGKLTSENHLLYYGRADHMMIMNGMNIYPAEIESCLNEHAAVSDAAAVPFRHPVHQDIPVCAVSLNRGIFATEKGLHEHARKRLGSHGPHRVFILDEIPRNEQGKLQRKVLNALLIQRMNPDKEKKRLDMLASRIASGRQLYHIIHLNIGLPAIIDQSSSVQQLDQWLENVLHIGLDDPDKSADQGERWLHRCLLIMRHLLQEACIPAFDPALLLNSRPDKEQALHWQVSIRVPRIDAMPDKVYTSALRQALELSVWKAGYQIDQKNTRELLGNMIKRMSNELAGLFPNGKSIMPVLEIAYQKGIPFSHLSDGTYQMGWGKNAILLGQGASGRDSMPGARAANNKVLAATLLQRGKRHISHYLDTQMRDAGLIPVEVFVGGEAARSAALDKRERWAEQDIGSCFTSAAETQHANGEPWPMTLTTTFQRTRAMALSGNTGALVIHVSDDEFLNTGLPLESVSNVTIVDQDLCTAGDRNTELPADRKHLLLALLENWRRHPACRNSTARKNR